MCSPDQGYIRVSVYDVIVVEYKIKYIITHFQLNILSSIFIPSNSGNVSRRGGQALSPHGEEAYKDLIYLNDAYKRAIIDTQGQEESSWDMENSSNTLLWNGRGLNMCFRWAV